jgi:hypothetical protein
MVRQPYTAAEKERIVAKGEARLGLQHFIGHSAVVSTQKSVVSLENAIVDAEDKLHFEYTELFAKAVANLRTSQELRGE